MPTTSQRPTLTIPAAYLEDARTAMTKELKRDAEQLSLDQRDLLEGRFVGVASQRASSMRILQRDQELLDQLLEATTQPDWTVSADDDKLSNPLLVLLEGMTEVLRDRLSDTCGYSPKPMRDVLDLAEELRWAATEAIRIEPGLDDRVREVA